MKYIRSKTCVVEGITTDQLLNLTTACQAVPGFNPLPEPVRESLMAWGHTFFHKLQLVYLS